MKCDKQAVKVSFGKRNAKATKYKRLKVFQKQTFIVSIYFLAICTELTSFAEFRPQKVIKNLFMSFGTIFWDVILGWYYDILGWKLCKQTSYWSKTGFFSQLKIILNFHPKITSQNFVPKDMNKSIHNRQKWKQQLIPRKRKYFQFQFKTY